MSKITTINQMPVISLRNLAAELHLSEKAILAQIRRFKSYLGSGLISVPNPDNPEQLSHFFTETGCECLAVIFNNQKIYQIYEHHITKLFKNSLPDTT